MSKTNEIDVYIQKKYYQAIKNEVCCEYMSKDESDIDGESLKAKLIIEIPEKKIEFTEQELRTAMYHAGAKGHSPFHEMVIKELGF